MYYKSAKRGESVQLDQIAVFRSYFRFHWFRRKENEDSFAPVQLNRKCDLAVFSVAGQFIEVTRVQINFVGVFACFDGDGVADSLPVTAADEVAFAVICVREFSCGNGLAIPLDAGNNVSVQLTKLFRNFRKFICGFRNEYLLINNMLSDEFAVDDGSLHDEIFVQ